MYYKRNTYFNKFLFIALMFTACTNTNYDKTLLYGDWVVDSWVIENTGKAITNQMDMNFKPNDQYTIDYGSEQENGKYWIMGDYLHTIEKGQAEKKVKLISLSADTLKFQMNRGGHLELITLKKTNG